MASGLEGFLGCPTVIYESEFVDFFNNGSVRDGLVVSNVNRVPVEFSEQLFAETFELPVDGLADLSEMPKDKIFDARSIVSLSGEPVSLSGRKGQMKIEYRLLYDIMEKAISVKAGSFNALTVEKFSLLTALVCGIRMNWASILFNILKKMLSAGSKQAKGFAVQISLLLESIPNLKLGESTEFPASKILTDKTVHRSISIIDKMGGEETADAPLVKKAPKKPAVSKKRPADAAEEQVNQTVDEDAETFAADDVDHIIQQVLSKTAQSASTEGEQIEELDIRGSAVAGHSTVTIDERQWFDLPYEDLIAKWDAEKKVTTPSDTDEEIEAERASEPVDRVQTEVSQPEYLVEKSADMVKSTADQSVDEFIDADEARSLEDIILSIPDDVPLPSAGVEITKITFGKEIKIPGVDEKACYLATLLQIPVDKKGKEILVEKDHVKGNPAKEHFSLICADIDMLVNLRAQVIDDVDQFFNSFSFKKLATMNLEGISARGEQVLLWGETENIHVALARKKYILLKYRAVLVKKFLDSWKNNFVPGLGSSAVDLRVIDLLSDLHLFVLEELTKEARAHGLSWKNTCCSKIFEGSPRDRGAVIARSNTNTRSSCWIRTMIRVNGTWVIETCADKWVKIPQQIISCEVHRQRQYDDILPSVSEFFIMIKKRWADICYEVVAFCSSRRLLPVGSVNFCRGLPVGEPVFRVAPRQSPVFALRVSQFCSVFIDFSLFSWLPTADITDFLYSIALDRTVFRSEQIAQNTVSVAPSVQMLAEPSSSESSSHDISMDFADTAAAAPTPDITDALNQLRASIDQICERDEGAKLRDILSLHLSNLENKVIARLDAQDKLLGALRRDSTDHRNLLSLELRSSHKQLSTGIVTTCLDVVDIRRVVKETHQELIAKINSLDEQVAATRNDLLEFSAHAYQSLNVITTQLSELVAYINRGGDNKKGESSSRGPQSQSQPPPSDVQNLESGQYISLEEAAERIREADRRQAEAERERERQRRIRRLSGSSKRRRY
ncbi:dystroglycan-like [Dorcoceras hygrometricum]|uniref:Dystroglycan-like n=1 Tax=Dorcoceras hygrometricum TaxID=472368 RepID=A0A2Z7AXJ8_9LAMI|nr:dystroglycan-like [Dorcoceras hygrometricum]